MSKLKVLLLAEQDLRNQNEILAKGMRDLSNWDATAVTTQEHEMSRIGELVTTTDVVIIQNKLSEETIWNMSDEVRSETKTRIVTYGVGKADEDLIDLWQELIQAGFMVIPAMGDPCQAVRVGGATFETMIVAEQDFSNDTPHITRIPSEGGCYTPTMLEEVARGNQVISDVSDWCWILHPDLPIIKDGIGAEEVAETRTRRKPHEYYLMGYTGEAGVDLAESQRWWVLRNFSPRVVVPRWEAYLRWMLGREVV